jgi:hypothetical protein
MTRIAETFARCGAEGRAALVTFVTGGDPSPASTPAILDALVEGGADLIELGLPFTDPMADGPAIQLANLRALGAGTTTKALLQIATEFRARHPSVPLVLMGYANPMLRRGADWFADECAKAGVDGIICVDVPVEEDPAFGPALRAKGVDFIRLATPTTDAGRLSSVTQHRIAAGGAGVDRGSGFTIEGGHRSPHRGGLWRSHAGTGGGDWQGRGRRRRRFGDRRGDCECRGQGREPGCSRWRRRRRTCGGAQK